MFFFTIFTRKILKLKKFKISTNLLKFSFWMIFIKIYLSFGFRVTKVIMTIFQWFLLVFTVKKYENHAIPLQKEAS